MSFLLDTDTCSIHLKTHRTVNNRVLQYSGGYYVLAVTVAELYTWVLRANAPPRRLESLEEFLLDAIVLDVTRAVARRFGEVRAALLDRGACRHRKWTCSSRRQRSCTISRSSPITPATSQT
jgi:tRNA(fMet)-specific endonuclease VapC